MTDYTIKPGDTLMALAAQFGLKDWTTIHDHPQNAELKKRCPDPGILPSGVSLYIPNPILGEDPSATDAKHQFRVARPKAWLRLALKDAAGAPLTGQYTLTVEGTTLRGTLAADGIVEQPVPVNARTATLDLVTPGGTTEQWSLNLGFMEPIDTNAGVAARLHNLGFGPADPDACSDDALAAAVKAFQVRIGLDATGTLDDPLRQKMAAYYDPAQDETQQDVAAAENAEGGSSA
jgi:N-acetylmuramoyl-L-alanine amidase